MTASRRRPSSRLPRAAVAALLLAMTVRLPEAPATIAEQRARLPPAAECESEVAGRWKAIAYSANNGWWNDFTLEIRHVEGSEGALTGTIRVDHWVGNPDQAEPGPCGGDRFKGEMEGSGSYSGGQVAFGGGPFKLTEVICGERYGVTYNPDNFTGRIEKERQEFQSVNNDGGAAVNDPYVFRRISCFDDEPNPSGPTAAAVQAPPFYPPRRSSGCGVSDGGAR